MMKWDEMHWLDSSCVFLIYFAGLGGRIGVEWSGVEWNGYRRGMNHDV